MAYLSRYDLKKGCFIKRLSINSLTLKDSAAMIASLRREPNYGRLIEQIKKSNNKQNKRFYFAHTKHGNQFSLLVTMPLSP